MFDTFLAIFLIIGGIVWLLDLYKVFILKQQLTQFSLFAVLVYTGTSLIAAGIQKLQ